MQKITTAVLLMVSLFAFSQQKNTVQSKSFSTKNKKMSIKISRPQYILWSAETLSNI